MPRYSPRPTAFSYSFGPGPMTPGVKWLLIATIAGFVASLMSRDVIDYLGLSPQLVIERGWIWQPVTYLFMHAGMFHILFNMLGVWMFGIELERMWGTRYFLRYYAVTGVGAAATVIAVSLLPFQATAQSYESITIGASGALYGLLMAYAIYYPDRPILMFLIFPVPAKYFVMIIGAIAFLSGPGGQVSNMAHLGGLLFGYLYLQNGRGGLGAEIKYRYLTWKMNRLRRKFDVHTGGRSDYDRKIH